MLRRTTTLSFAMTILLLVGLFAACGGEQEKPASTLSKAGRDSVLSESALSGASVVKSALSVADSAQGLADRLNRMSGSGDH